MQVLVIGGFLGSGKTTLLLRVARELAARGLRVAVIENEVGTIGLDHQYLELEGIAVQDLQGGCVCCVLKGQLSSMLDRIEQTLRPDWVLVEPSGVAVPGDLVPALRARRGPPGGVQVVNILDAPRFEVLAEALQPMVQGYVETADVIAVNKIDAVNDTVLREVRRQIEALGPGKRIVELCCETGEHVGTLVNEVVTS